MQKNSNLEFKARNPPWSRDELILALELYLRFRTAPPSKSSKEIEDLSKALSQLAAKSTGHPTSTYRNPNGVYMKMMNFRRFDPEYTSAGKVGLSRGNKLEEILWEEFANNPKSLALAVESINVQGTANIASAAPYWVFVCNPKKWAIDEFLESNTLNDTWGVRPSDQSRFAAGQLAIIRVGVDKRSMAALKGRPRLEPGIYALCEVTSEVFAGAGANDKFWSSSSERAPGWPTVKIRYLKSYLSTPLSIDRLKKDAPNVSSLLLNGFQASSFPISSADFQSVMQLLDSSYEDTVANSGLPIFGQTVSDQEKIFLHASPEVKERLSKYIERGKVGESLKKEREYKCQICEALGQEPISFKKANGVPYAEAHHVMPVSKLQIGSLAKSNILVLCANHHRQMHYGSVSVTIEDSQFKIKIEENTIFIPRSF